MRERTEITKQFQVAMRIAKQMKTREEIEIKEEKWLCCEKEQNRTNVYEETYQNGDVLLFRDLYGKRICMGELVE